MKGRGCWIVLAAAVLAAWASGWAEPIPPVRLPTAQEAATDHFFSRLEAALAQKFFHFRTRPVVRVAVFDLTDGQGNVVKAGRELADTLTRRLHSQPQFEVVAPQKVRRYLEWNGLSSLGKVEATDLLRLQRRIRTLDPENGVHALVTGEVQRAAGRTIRVSAWLINFQFPVGPIEREKNLLDLVSVAAEIPLPTEQAWQEASEIVLPRQRRELPEGRLLILANTRGSRLAETEHITQFQSDRSFPWMGVSRALVAGAEESLAPEQVRIGLGLRSLESLGEGETPEKKLEYAFLSGKLGTNEIFFDGPLPAQHYPLLISFLDGRSSEIHSLSAEIAVHPGATTLAVVSMYVPSEKERIRQRQMPRIRIFQLFGRGTEIWPNG